MNYALEVTHVIKNKNNRFYTTCTIDFSEEERAIIRERNMGVYLLLFRRGYVNYPDLAGQDISEEITWAVYIALAVLAVVLCSEFSILAALIPALLALAFYDHTLQVAKANESSERETIALSEIMDDGSFSVCGFDDMFKSKAIEQEMHEQMARLKALLNISGEDLGARWHRL